MLYVPRIIYIYIYIIFFRGPLVDAFVAVVGDRRNAKPLHIVQAERDCSSAAAALTYASLSAASPAIVCYFR